MGFINKVKGEDAAKRAREARQARNKVFVYKFIESLSGAMVSGPMSGLAEQIDSIEGEGWDLAQMAAVESKAISGERAAVVCLFRRRED